MWPADPSQTAEPDAVVDRCGRPPRHARQVASCRRSLRAGSMRSTRPGAGRCSSSSPGASARRRFGAARQDRGSGARRQGAAGDRTDLARTRPPYTELFAWLEGRADKPASARSRAVPPGDAGACDRGNGFRRARSGRFHGGVEMGRHPRAGRRRHGARTAARDAALFAHRRGYFRRAFPICSRRCASTARSTANCWSCATAACRAFNVLQQRLNRKTVDAETARRISRASARLRSAGRRRARICASARSPSAARGWKRSSRGSTIRASISRRWCRSRPGRSSPPRAPIRRRPAPATMPTRSKASCSSAATRPIVPGRPKGPVVEMEARSVSSSTPC